MSTKTTTSPTVRTYRGKSLEELIPKIQAELGPDAIILREREGLTGGVNGFFAQRCVEVDVQAPGALSPEMQASSLAPAAVETLRRTAIDFYDDADVALPPAFGLPALWIADAQHAEAEALGYTVVDGESVIVTHLTETIRNHAAQLLTRQDVRQLLDQLKESNEAVVNEVVPDVLSLGEIQRVLQALLSEGVSIRDLGAIVEAVGDKARITRDPSLLAEYARQALGRATTAPHLDAQQTLRAITLDPSIEQEVATSITQTTDGEYLAMEPARAHQVVGALRTESDQAAARAGIRPVLLCSARVRRHLRRLVEQPVPQLAVCSYNEIAPGINVETIGVVTA